eukprot:1052225-Prorocentrum_minimum.AAC.5
MDKESVPFDVPLMRSVSLKGILRTVRYARYRGEDPYQQESTRAFPKMREAFVCISRLRHLNA